MMYHPLHLHGHTSPWTVRRTAQDAAIVPAGQTLTALFDADNRACG
jgi:FtsP/CotA-like multicopper oxidase with cupredoxin domain